MCSPQNAAATASKDDRTGYPFLRAHSHSILSTASDTNNNTAIIRGLSAVQLSPDDDEGTADTVQLMIMQSENTSSEPHLPISILSDTSMLAACGDEECGCSEVGQQLPTTSAAAVGNNAAYGPLPPTTAGTPNAAGPMPPATVGSAPPAAGPLPAAATGTPPSAAGLLLPAAATGTLPADRPLPADDPHGREGRNHRPDNHQQNYLIKRRYCVREMSDLERFGLLVRQATGGRPLSEVLQSLRAQRHRHETAGCIHSKETGPLKSPFQEWVEIGSQLAMERITAGQQGPVGASTSASASLEKKF